MGLGLDMFKAVRSKKKSNDLQVTTPVAYPTGFINLDYLNGQRVKVFDDNDNIIQEYDSVGFVDGTFVTVIADPGLGKTTLVQQIAVQIASQFEDSFVIHEDIEQSSHINRVYNITYQRPRWINNHYAIYQDTHAEPIIDRFLDHAKMKLNDRKKFEYDTGLKDMFGNPIKRLIPTVVILDSLAVMRSENASIKEDFDAKNRDDIENTGGNNMAGARNAKFNSEMFKQILPWAKRANIILFVINQINNKVETGFVKSARALVGLGENETISGGRASLYLANNVLRLKNKGMLKHDKDYGINGLIVDITFYKSRTSASNVSGELIFDKSKGFSSSLSLLNFAINNNIVKKSGTKFVIPGDEDIPFTKKNFCEVVAEHPKLIVDLYDATFPIMQELIDASSNASYENESEESRLDSYVNILNMLNED